VAVDPFAYLFSLEQFGVKFGLANMRAIIAALGEPHRDFRSVHIAGTNGKGSVSAMVEAVLRAAGLHTGRYTSPHLIRLTERFAIDGQEVTEATLREAVSEVITAVEHLRQRQVLETHPTFFEVTTASAFTLFRQHQVDIAVCEVGLGGRLDATNVLSPMATAITSIGFDHQQYLGTTLPEIAAEKAGTIKPQTPVIVGRVPPEVRAVIAQVAREQAAPLIDAARGVEIEVHPGRADAPQRVTVRTPTRRYESLELSLRGAHQIDNAIVAIRLLESLQLPGVDEAAIRQGLRNAVWPGRLQRVTTASGRVALLDAAHNPDGAQSLAAYLKMRGTFPVVFAAMRDKDAEGILKALRDSVSALVVTRASHPRSSDPSALADVAARVLKSDVPISTCDSPTDALEQAWQYGPEIVVAGSIFLLGDVMQALSGPVIRSHDLP
jgi:dihydrofolate synthase / folylpolyglutamate synthase